MEPFSTTERAIFALSNKDLAHYTQHTARSLCDTDGLPQMGELYWVGNSGYPA